MCMGTKHYKRWEFRGSRAYKRESPQKELLFLWHTDVVKRVVHRAGS